MESARRLTPKEALRAAKVGAVVSRHLLPTIARRRTRTVAAVAPRLHDAVVDLGPPFVKLSQVVASSPGLFPVAISDSLRGLLDAAPPVPFPPIRDAIEAGLGRPLESVFSSFEEHPVAAASVAQVHAATTTDGRRVVVKVLRPNVERQFLTDLRLLRVVARTASRLSKSARVINPVAVVDDVVIQLSRELDMDREADSMERFSANLRAYGSNDMVRVPEVHRDLCGPGVLTMERIDGIKVDDVFQLNLTGLDLTGLLKAGVRAWIESALQHRFFHGDVHAGNLFVDTEGRVVFIDFGIVGELDEVTADIVRRGIVGLLHDRDFQTVTDCLVELGANLGYGLDSAKAAAAIQRLAEPLLDKPLSEIDYRDVFFSALRQAAAKGVQVPSSLVLLIKQILYFERYAKLVAPDYELLSDTFLIEFLLDDEPSA
ncbi:MAG: phosphotransferase [Actinobacteria bacterium]|nr:phosphotransferase [Actinomycetota bacterium]MBW3649608.1 phosphotransferase [Actinomycetota bacterium]